LWEQALAASLRATHAVLPAKDRCNSGESMFAAIVGGKERWLRQAVETVVQIAAERLYGGSQSADFHDLALIRCDTASVASCSHNLTNSLQRSATAVISPAQLAHMFHGTLLDLQQRWSAGSTENRRSTPEQRSQRGDSRASLSYTTNAILHCPLSSLEMQAKGTSRSVTSVSDPRWLSTSSADSGPPSSSGAGHAKLDKHIGSAKSTTSRKVFHELNKAPTVSKRKQGS